MASGVVEPVLMPSRVSPSATTPPPDSTARSLLWVNLAASGASWLPRAEHRNPAQASPAKSTAPDSAVPMRAAARPGVSSSTAASAAPAALAVSRTRRIKPSLAPSRSPAAMAAGTPPTTPRRVARGRGGSGRALST
ncbi:hypothetical protein SMICM304S_12233 [Streptomyces microflavus]